ncbi:MAG: YigZ family protein [Ignavibacteriaceae bacterium]
MQKIKQYTTIKGPSEFIYKEKGSEFIARAFPAEKEEDFIKFLNDVKKKYYDAAHHCYAVKIIDGYTKYSDDGEPGGTAGIRIMNAIEHFYLYDVFLVVIRYFGGTKLGVGPLGKAYYIAAEGVLNNCEKILKKAFVKIIVEGDFSLVSQIHRIFTQNKIKILQTEYKENVKFDCLVEPDMLNQVKKQLIEASRGSIAIKIPDKTLFYQAIE